LIDLADGAWEQLNLPEIWAVGVGFQKKKKPSANTPEIIGESVGYDAVKVQYDTTSFFPGVPRSVLILKSKRFVFS